MNGILKNNNIFMMTDNEILKLAAMAVDIEWSESELHGWYKDHDNTWAIWNPLEDNGNAFTLMIELGINLAFDVIHKCTYVHHRCGCIAIDGTEYSDVRRGIVLAAAEIRKNQNGD